MKSSESTTAGTGARTSGTDAPAEADLIRHSQAGDKEAFGVIVKRYAGAATGAAYLILGTRADALDASQEAFARAWRHIGKFNIGAPFYPWYARILRNVCLSALRRRRLRKAETLSLDNLPAAEATADTDPMLAIQRTEQREGIRRAILSLPVNYREIIVMSHFQEMSYKQIAAALEVPMGTVMSRLYNARKALRNLLLEEGR